MNYGIFFNLVLDLDDKPAPHVRTASGTDMGAISFTTLMFAINGHVFTPQFIVCRSQTSIVQVVSGLLMAQRDLLHIVS